MAVYLEGAAYVHLLEFRGDRKDRNNRGDGKSGNRNSRSATLGQDEKGAKHANSSAIGNCRDSGSYTANPTLPFL